MEGKPRKQRNCTYKTFGVPVGNVDAVPVLWPLEDVPIGGIIVENDTPVTLLVFVGEAIEGIPYIQVPSGYASSRPVLNNGRFFTIMPAGAPGTQGIVRVWLTEEAQNWAQVPTQVSGGGVTELSELSDIDFTNATPGTILVKN